MRKITILLIGFLLCGVGMFSGCLQKPTYSESNRSNPTNVEIVGRSSRTGFEGFDYVVYIDVTVHNQGNESKATIWVSLAQGGNQWTKNQEIYLNQGEARDLMFTFHEANFWSLSGFTYQIWVA